MQAERIHLLNGAFDPLTLGQTVSAVFGRVELGQRGWLCTVNVAILMMMRRDRWLQNFVDRATWIVADGQPLVWSSRWLARPLPERVAGVDLLEAICERSARDGRGVYLLGATTEVVRAAAQRLRARHPLLRIDCSDGYFASDEAPTRADQVRTSGADILFVGMGVPRQERFIDEQWQRLGVSVAIGVGGTFDVLAGLRARAPGWMQRSGLEWLFRLIQEPRRLFWRYVTTNARFVWLVARALVKRGDAS